MPNKNIIIQIFKMAIGITKFSLLVTFYLGWGFILISHQRASTSETLIINNFKQPTSNTNQKIFPLPTQRRSSISHRKQS
jgi:hypothetical protein